MMCWFQVHAHGGHRNVRSLLVPVFNQIYLSGGRRAALMWMETIKESLPAEVEICVRHHHRELHVHTDGKNFLSKINELQMQVGDLSQI